MCLALIENSGREPKVAQEDIVCYKVMKVNIDYADNEYLAPFQDFHYIRDRENHLSPKDEKRFMNIEKGIWLAPDVEKIECGFHSIPTQEHAEKFANDYLFEEDEVTSYPVVECVIPKGALYWTGVWGDDFDIPNYCSNKIIVKGEI
jgi:hypothetical protein